MRIPIHPNRLSISSSFTNLKRRYESVRYCTCDDRLAVVLQRTYNDSSRSPTNELLSLQERVSLINKSIFNYIDHYYRVQDILRRPNFWWSKRLITLLCEHERDFNLVHSERERLGPTRNSSERSSRFINFLVSPSKFALTIGHLRK